MNFGSWLKNPQYVLTVKKQGKIEFGLCQSVTSPMPSFGIVIWKDEDGTPSSFSSSSFLYLLLPPSCLPQLSISPNRSPFLVFVLVVITPLVLFRWKTKDEDPWQGLRFAVFLQLSLSYSTPLLSFSSSLSSSPPPSFLPSSPSHLFFPFPSPPSSSSSSFFPILPHFLSLFPSLHSLASLLFPFS